MVSALMRQLSFFCREFGKSFFLGHFFCLALRDDDSDEDGFLALLVVVAGLVAARDFTVVPFFVVPADVAFSFVAISVDDVAARGLLLAPAELVLAKPDASSGGGASSVFFDAIVFTEAPRPLRGGASVMVATSIDGRRGGLGAFTNGLDDASSAPSGEAWLSSVF